MAQGGVVEAPPPGAMALPGIPYERRLLIMADPRDKALQDYRKKLLEHKEIDGRLKERECTPLIAPGAVREGSREEIRGPSGAAAAAALRHGPAPGLVLRHRGLRLPHGPAPGTSRGFSGCCS